MAGTREGGLKSAKKIGREALAERGRKGGKNTTYHGFSDKPGLAQTAGAAGGKARARKYQDPNFDKELYRKRRAAGLSGQERPRTIVSALSPLEYERRNALKRGNKENSHGN